MPLPAPDDLSPAPEAPYGPPPPRALPSAEALTAEILRQAGGGRSITPEDVARALGGEDWHPLMAPVRNAAFALAREGRLLVLRKGKPVDPEGVKGVIRLAIPGEQP
jgi:hypothetical protein